MLPQEIGCACPDCECRVCGWSHEMLRAFLRSLQTSQKPLTSRSDFSFLCTMINTQQNTTAAVRPEVRALHCLAVPPAMAMWETVAHASPYSFLVQMSALRMPSA